MTENVNSFFSPQTSMNVLTRRFVTPTPSARTKLEAMCVSVKTVTEETELLVPVSSGLHVSFLFHYIAEALLLARSIFLNSNSRVRLFPTKAIFERRFDSKTGLIQVPVFLSILLLKKLKHTRTI